MKSPFAYTFAFLALAFAVSALLTPNACSALTIVAEETGGNVVFTFSGSLNVPTKSGPDDFRTEAGTYLDPSGGYINAWQSAMAPTNVFALAATVPFGTGSSNYSGIGSGSNISIYQDFLELDESYVAGSLLNTTLTFPNTTLAALGVNTAGAPYVWTVSGTGDTITMLFRDAAAIAAEKSQLSRQIKKLKKKIKKLKKNGQAAKSKKLKKKQKKLQKKLRAL